MKKTTTKLGNHGVNESESALIFKVYAIITKNAKCSKTTQENKIINMKNGKSDILPNLIVDEEDVDASHSAYISDFDKEQLFYMKSRGINENEARKLLIEGFLIGNLKIKDEYMDKIKAILINK